MQKNKTLLNKEYAFTVLQLLSFVTFGVCMRSQFVHFHRTLDEIGYRDVHQQENIKYGPKTLWPVSNGNLTFWQKSRAAFQRE